MVAKMAAKNLLRAHNFLNIIDSTMKTVANIEFSGMNNSNNHMKNYQGSSHYFNPSNRIRWQPKWLQKSQHNHLPAHNFLDIADSVSAHFGVSVHEDFRQN